MKYVVKESKWLRGSENSALLDSATNKMCCLGFVGLQGGLTKCDIRDEATPEETIGYLFNESYDSSKLKHWPSWLYNRKTKTNTRDCTKLIAINDSLTLTDNQRKQQIREIFKKHGDQIVFSQK